MKNFFLIFGILLFSSKVFSQDTRLLRNPDMGEKYVVFCYAEDLWRCDLDGSNTLRLTTYQGSESDPKISPDGQTVAFTGQYDGNVDIYTTSINGGTPKRMTWHPGVDLMSNWTEDGSALIFSSGRTNAPYDEVEEFWSVSLKGGTPTRFIVPTGANGTFNPGSTHFVYEPIRPWETEFRNYRGGQNKPLWIFDMKSHDCVQMPWTNSRDMRPVWIGTKIYFLSDRDLAMNIWEYDTQAKTVKQLTNFKEFDCKNLEGNASSLIFEYGGYLHTYSLSSGTSKQLNIKVTGDFPWIRPHFVDMSEFITDINLSPNGKRVVVASRGEIITVPIEDGSPRNLTNTSGASDRAVAWSADGQSISWFSDESGEYQLIIADQFGKRKKTIKFDDPTFYYMPEWSPDSKYISFYNEGRILQYVNVETGTVTRIDEEMFAHPQHVIYGAWSPDSKWVAYTKRLKNEFSAIFIYSLAEKKSYQITDGMSDCNSPAWDQSGDYLYFMSSIDYGPNVAWLDMSQSDHTTNRSIYAFALNKEVKSPIHTESGDEEASEEEDEKEKEKENENENEKEEDGEEEDVTDLKIDFENIHQRLIPLPLPVRNYVQLLGGAEGSLFVTESKKNQDGLSLWKYELKGDEPLEVKSGIYYFVLNHKRTHIALYNTDNSISVAGIDEMDKAKPLGTYSIKVDPLLEAKQIFKEAWRFQRDYFYVENVHGLDMDWVYKTYSPWIEHVKHREDLNYVLDILGGETSIGHSFVGGGDYPSVNRVNIGLLGADVEMDGSGFVIKKIFTGEMWNSDVKAPLFQPGMDVKVGDYIVAVNGIPLDKNSNFFAAFENLAGQEIKLSVNSSAKVEGAKVLTVTPISNEFMLRSHDWVESNRRKVDELSGGKLAYLWLPDTGEGGFSNFNRYYFAQKDKKGIIVDERDNHGGLIADYITDLLSRDLLGYFNNPIGDKQPLTAPNGAIFGPKVMLINESAGSGGDMLPYMFKERKLGTLVGTTTWGGLVGIWDVPGLMDGGYMTAPRGGFYNVKGEWDVENIGVSPDVLVEMVPKLVIQGHDPQLEEGVRQAMELLKTQEVKLIPQPADPIRSVRPE